MVIPKCKVCNSLDWVEAWAGVLRCHWCGALMSLRTGTIIKCGDLQRPVVKDEVFEVVGEYSEAFDDTSEPIVSTGIQRPEDWMIY